MKILDLLGTIVAIAGIGLILAIFGMMLLMLAKDVWNEWRS